jgi:hypothetical protein
MLIVSAVYDIYHLLFICLKFPGITETVCQVFQKTKKYLRLSGPFSKFVKS